VTPQWEENSGWYGTRFLNQRLPYPSGTARYQDVSSPGHRP
jgi:hypothetical protein